MPWLRKRANCTIIIGGVYSVVRKGNFGVIKILAFEADKIIVYARIYKVRFHSDKEAAELIQENHTAEEMLPQFGMDIGVLPVTQRVFNYWKPKLLFQQAITDEEQSTLGFCFAKAKPWDKLLYP